MPVRRSTRTSLMFGLPPERAQLLLGIAQLAYGVFVLILGLRDRAFLIK